MSPIILPAWFGEFGWEVMSWAPWCRARSRESGGAIITSFGASRALYADFATKFRDHGGRERSLNYPKDFRMYRSDGPNFEHQRYGRRPGQSGQSGQRGPICLHLRGIARKGSINYRRWPAVLAALRGLDIACLGTPADGCVPGAADYRGLPLEQQMDLLASASVCVGCSSGTMHLAAACGCDLVVWGDTKTRYGETLQRRYRATWNPHHVRVAWLDADDWDPDPARIIRALEGIETPGPD